MKNIVLMGVPRSGKSTFAKMILNNYKNYSIIQADVIKSMYIDLCRYNAHKNSNNIISIDNEASKRMVRYCFDCYVKWEPDINFILDTFDFDIEAAKEYLIKGYIVIVFGYPNITLDVAVKNILKYDKKNDWTYTESVSRLEYYFDVYIKDSKEYEIECKKNNIKFVDTSQNREIVLKELFEWLKNVIQI